MPVVPNRESGSASEWYSNLTLKQMFVHYQILVAFSTKEKPLELRKLEF